MTERENRGTKKKEKYNERKKEKMWGETERKSK